MGQRVDLGAGAGRGLEPHPPGCLPRVSGSYEHLWAGQVADALVDLTGGLAERWNLKDLARPGGQQDRPGSQQDRPGASEPRTCRQLLVLKDRCLISCSVLNPRSGTAEQVVAGWARVLPRPRRLPGHAGTLCCGPSGTKEKAEHLPLGAEGFGRGG